MHPGKGNPPEMENPEDKNSKGKLTIGAQTTGNGQFTNLKNVV
jgi:hypothetical protein